MTSGQAKRTASLREQGRGTLNRFGSSSPKRDKGLGDEGGSGSRSSLSSYVELYLFLGKSLTTIANRLVILPLLPNLAQHRRVLPV